MTQPELLLLKLLTSSESSRLMPPEASLSTESSVPAGSSRQRLSSPKMTAANTASPSRYMMLPDAPLAAMSMTSRVSPLR